MTIVEREALKKRIVNYFFDVASCDKNATVKHFKQEKIPERTIYFITSRYFRTNTTEDLLRSGRPLKLGTQKIRQLIKSFNNRDGKSQRVERKNFRFVKKLFVII